MKLKAADGGSKWSCRSPCGERGLKSFPPAACKRRTPSLPVRGAWVEIRCRKCRRRKADGRSPCGERGLKYPASLPPSSCARRSPCGERGLKYLRAIERPCPTLGRSPCGERGLKFTDRRMRIIYPQSLPVRGAWVEIYCRRHEPRQAWSLPVRGAWVEIPTALRHP